MSFSFGSPTTTSGSAFGTTTTSTGNLTYFYINIIAITIAWPLI